MRWADRISVPAILLGAILAAPPASAQDQTAGLFLSEPSSSVGYTLFAP